jgi:hypothetical protein
LGVLGEAGGGVKASKRIQKPPSITPICCLLFQEIQKQAKNYQKARKNNQICSRKGKSLKML